MCINFDKYQKALVFYFMRVFVNTTAKRQLDKSLIFNLIFVTIL